MTTRLELPCTLPTKSVLFLGGHQNLTKKLRQLFPKWSFVTDERLKRYSAVNHPIVFYWTGHGSHKMMRYIYSKLPENAYIIYVTATNLPLLITEMQQAYQQLIDQI